MLIVHFAPPPTLNKNFSRKMYVGEGVRGLETRGVLFAAEIGKLTNSQGWGGDGQKKGVRLEIWTTILNNFLA